MVPLSLPGDLDPHAITEVVARQWGVVGSPERLPVGGDSWSFRIADAFVNVRPAQGQRTSWRRPRNVEAAFAAATRLAPTLDFLLAPTPTDKGAPVAYCGRFVVSVWPFLQGQVHYRPYDARELTQVSEWIARLHAATAAADDIPVDREDFEVRLTDPLRAGLERVETSDGPYAARFMALLEKHRSNVLTQVVEFEALAGQLRSRPYHPVLTHGEPFPGNVFEESGGRRWLIDLGELMLAPRERDLGYLVMLADAADRDVPERVYGAANDPDYVRFYQLHWGLSEIAEYVDRFAGPHDGGAEDEFAWNELTAYYLQP